MDRKRAFAVSIALIAIACFGFESATFAQAARTKPKTKAASSASSNGKPTVADAKTVIEKQISGARFKVTSITKTNGAENRMLNHYQIFYAVQVTCLVGERGKPFYLKFGDPSTTWAVKCDHEGDVSNGVGSLYFLKTEQGWKPVSSSDHQPKWFERVEAVFQPASDRDTILVPVRKGSTKSPSRKAPPVSLEYDRFLGVWTFSDEFDFKRYLRITRDQEGRFQFDEGWNNDQNVVSDITWGRDDIILSNADGIYLKPLKGKLHAKFVSANFRATHGHDFSYQIMLQFQPNGKLLYSLSGDVQEKHTATKIDEK